MTMPEQDQRDRAVSRPDVAADGLVDPLRVLVVDDHTLIRSALRLLIETQLGYEVTEVSSADDAVHAAAAGHFDIVLLDLFMPGRDGLWALKQIRRSRPRLPIVMLTYFADEASVREALTSGAAGYVMKDAKIDQLADAISTAVSGRGVYLHPLAAECLVVQRPDAPGEALTEREHEVLALLVDGATNERIAATLFITEKTVKSHLSGVFRKLGVANRTQAATKAVRERLVKSGPAGGDEVARRWCDQRPTGSGPSSDHVGIGGT